ncbi:hypothetical protein LguiB_014749 [Lonicera macranthoides]
MADTKLMEQTCKITPYYQLCISTLNSDPKSRTADVSGLGLIIVKTVKSRTIHTIDLIKKLQRSNPGLRKQLSECGNKYNTILIGDIEEAEQGLEFGDPKFAESGMNDAANEADGCEKMFDGSKSPLKEMNKAVYELSLVSVAIIRLLL